MDQLKYFGYFWVFSTKAQLHKLHNGCQQEEIQENFIQFRLNSEPAAYANWTMGKGNWKWSYNLMKFQCWLHNEKWMSRLQTNSQSHLRCGLGLPKLYIGDQVKWDLPAENGMKALGLTNSPHSFRKFSGVKSWGDFHWPSSCSAEEREGMIIVPWRKRRRLTKVKNKKLEMLRKSITVKPKVSSGQERFLAPFSLGCSLVSL